MPKFFFFKIIQRYWKLNILMARNFKKVRSQIGKSEEKSEEQK